MSAEIADWIWLNKEWIFSGAGVAVVGGIVAYLNVRRGESAEASNLPVTQTNNVIVNVAGPQGQPKQSVDDYQAFENKAGDLAAKGAVSEGRPTRRGSAMLSAILDDLSAAKNVTKILFIDDDTTFAVVRILKTAGWIHTKIIKDVRSLDDPDVKGADIFFVDIQGVGKSLQFRDQGLGLAKALKQKYATKRLVIYSAEPKHEMFHEAFRLADDKLSKTADPYEFQSIIENFALGRE